MIRAQTSDLDRLEQDIWQHFGSTPLRAIGEALRTELQALSKFAPVNRDQQSVSNAFARVCRRLIDNIPGPADITDRFYFDFAMIHAIVGEWASPQPLLPRSIIPRCGDEWSYRYEWLPTHSREQSQIRIPRIDTIDFPGGAGARDIALLTYPWLYHELGHVLMHRHGARYRERVGALLDQRRTEAAHRTLGLPDTVRRRHATLGEQMERAWRPVATQNDWSHEIAIDTVAVWSTGPAFLACFVDAVEDKDAYVTNQAHPPYEIRASALREAGLRLGWEQEMRAVDAYLERAGRESPSVKGDNDFIALFDKTLVTDIVSIALDTCSTLMLPRCDAAQLSMVDELLDADRLPELGMPVILAAWRCYQRNSDSFHDWEKNVVQKHVLGLRP